MRMDSPKHEYDADTTEDIYKNSINEDCDAAPSCLIIQNFPPDVFIDDEIKEQFEQLFSIYGKAYFTYLPGFQRIIVKYTSVDNATAAKQQLHGVSLDDERVLKVYFKEEAKKFGGDFLCLPKAQRLFLISPPASPPVGWEPCEEPIPVVNYDLLGAVARLEISGKPVELVSKTDITPGIVVIGCDDPDGNTNLVNMNTIPREQLQTSRPPLK